MVTYYDDGRTYGEPRLHPYGPADPSQSGHVDFKAHPELVHTALEDFRPFADRAAVQTFYSFLEWINGPDPGLGQHLMLSFWAYGDTEEAAFNNLNRLFSNLWAACRLVSGEITRVLNQEQETGR